MVRDGRIEFSVADLAGGVRGVRLWQENEIVRPDVNRDFVRGRFSRKWRLRVPRPDVDRMEYLLELDHGDGVALVPDPANPLRAGGPFGEKSVVEFPEYEPPAWVANGHGERGRVADISIRSRTLRAKVEGLLWSSPGSEDGRPLPLLVAYDGVEYAQYSALIRMLDWATGAGELPPMRAALLAPGDRNRNYAASPAYSYAVAREIVPALGELAPAPDRREQRVGMGTSLGALAMLHLHRVHPETFGALFLQSGSFFRAARDDERKWDFTPGRRISRFVREVLTAREWAHPIRVTMTCGRLEKNLANNRALRDALAAQGYDVYLHENRDLHNWVAWRDTFDPHLVRLLQRAWG